MRLLRLIAAEHLQLLTSHPDVTTKTSSNLNERLTCIDLRLGVAADFSHRLWTLDRLDLLQLECIYLPAGPELYTQRDAWLAHNSLHSGSACP